MKALQIIMISVLILAAVGCSSIRVKIDYNKSIDFLQYRTFAWAPNPGRTDGSRKWLGRGAACLRIGLAAGSCRFAARALTGAHKILRPSSGAAAETDAWQARPAAQTASVRLQSTAADSPDAAITDIPELTFIDALPRVAHCRTALATKF